MRLISTSDPSKLTLHSFREDKIPEYTVLSHSWRENSSEEVLFGEMLNQTDEIRRRPGFEKIQNCAKKSKELGYDWTWVDTCCIDQTNSAELSESLNSMYAWYRNSKLCIVFLEDFDGDDVDRATPNNRWFTRGWTLQELIAPEKVVFYSAKWKKIGDKKQNVQRLEELTWIDRKVLLSRDLENVSVAEKMKWVSNRNTKKVEDMAYCMFGIFGVHLATIYGEGDNAFRRLQEEIIRNFDDVTIFLWKEEGSPNPYAHRGALARSPKEFRESRAPRTPLCALPDPFSSTNKGIMMTTELYPLNESFCVGNIGLNDTNTRAEFRRGAIYALRFHEERPSKNGSNTILLKRLLLAPEQYQYCRVYPGYLFQTSYSHWSNNPKGLVTISERLPLSNFAAKLLCKRFEITLGGKNLEEENKVLHSNATPHGLKAAFISKHLPALRPESQGCLMLNLNAADSSIRASFLDATAFEKARERKVDEGNVDERTADERKADDEHALDKLAELAKTRKAKYFFIGDAFFRLTQETSHSYRARDTQVFFDFSRRHATEGVLLQVEISVVGISQ